MKKRINPWIIVFTFLLLASCSVFRKPAPVRECEEKNITTGEIAEIFVETRQDGLVNVYGSVTENEKPVEQGMIFFTNDSTRTITQEFVSNSFSVTLIPGMYSIKISGDLNLEYDLGKQEFKPGDVKRLDFFLHGYTMFIEKVSDNNKKVRRK